MQANSDDLRSKFINLVTLYIVTLKYQLIIAFIS